MAKPKIRFNGYTEDWEQRKLGDIADVTKLAGFEFTEHVVYSDEGNVIALRGLNIKNGQLILDDVKYIDGSNFSKLSRSKLFIDDIMFTYVGTVGEVAIIKENDRFYLAPNVSRIRVKSDDSPKFISHYMRTDNFKNKVIFPLIATSSQPALSMENIRKFTINIPINREEQDCLAKYFDSLDNLITLHQRKCEQTKTLKKYMLQKMFPQDGEKVPQIRFEGFTEDWEQRKLGDMGSTFTGLSGKTKEDFGHGDAQFITYMNVFSNPVANLEMTEAVEIDAKQNNVKKGDVFFTTSSETPEEVGMSCVMPENKDNIYLNSFCFGYRPTEKFDLDYLAYVLRADSFRKEMKFLAQGISRYNISKNKVMEVSIPVPKLAEQTMIGRYFSSLDHLITLHQRKCDELKEVKKFMLQNMFV